MSELPAGLGTPEGLIGFGFVMGATFALCMWFIFRAVVPSPMPILGAASAVFGIGVAFSKVAADAADREETATETGETA